MIMKKHSKKNPKTARGVSKLPVLASVSLLTVTMIGFGSIYGHASEAFANTTGQEKKMMSSIDTGLNNEINLVKSDYAAYGSIYTADGKEIFGPLCSSAGGPYFNIIGGIGFDSNYYVASVYNEDLYTVYNWFKGLDTEKTDIVLTLDSHMQESMSEYLESRGVNGTVICEDMSTGEIKLMVSTPGASDGSDQEQIGSQMNNNLHTTVPGSTMKIITCLLLEMQGIDISALQYECTGSHQLPDGSTITCEDPHGPIVTVMDAIGDSCNCFFAQAIENHVNWSKLTEDLQRLGFVVNSDENVKYSVGKLFSDASTLTFNEKTDFNSAFSLIGQGKTLVNPLHMMQIVSAIATGGDAPSPYLVNGSDAMAPLNFTEEEKSILNKVRVIWQDAYDEYYAIHLIYPESLLAAKTGTAQVGGDNMKKLLMGYSDRYAFYICIYNYVTDGVKLSTLPVDIANHLMNELEVLNNDNL